MTTSGKIEPEVFLDSSVFFAAAYSSTGSARDLMITAFQGRIRIVLSRYVLEETERNLLRRAPHAHPAFLVFRDEFPYVLSDPPESLVVDTERIVVGKDAPIIAAARAAEVSLVATYDRKDLLSKQQEIMAAFEITVATPEMILALLDMPRFRS